MAHQRSSDDLAGVVGRLLRALHRRALTGDDEAAVALVQLGRDARAMANDGLLAAHRAGYSYGDLGAFLGIARQSVAERVERAERRAGPPG